MIIIPQILQESTLQYYHLAERTGYNLQIAMKEKFQLPVAIDLHLFQTQKFPFAFDIVLEAAERVFAMEEAQLAWSYLLIPIPHKLANVMGAVFGLGRAR
jgi:hypothetical protein